MKLCSMQCSNASNYGHTVKVQYVGQTWEMFNCGEKFPETFQKNVSIILSTVFRTNTFPSKPFTKFLQICSKVSKSNKHTNFQTISRRFFEGCHFCSLSYPTSSKSLPLKNHVFLPTVHLMLRMIVGAKWVNKD